MIKEMKKLSLLAIFLLVSCAEEVKEESELERCIDANVSLIQNITLERLSNYPDLLQVPVKMTNDYLRSMFEEADMQGQLEFDDELNEKFQGLKNKETAIESFDYLQSMGILSEGMNINLDADEVYFTLVENMENINLQELIKEFSKYPEEVNFNTILSSTIRLTDEKTLKDIAQNTCWSQGIY